MEIQKKQRISAKELVYIAMFAVIMAVCAWISVPTAVPFTLQTFGVFCALEMLGGKRGAASILVYILLGMVGIPVFSGFSGGIGAVAGPTGGYILGFLLMALIYMALEKLTGDKLILRIAAMVIGLIVCYAFGTAWFVIVYSRNSGEIGVMTALTWCVFPFILPDLIKMGLALVVSSKIKKYVSV